MADTFELVENPAWAGKERPGLENAQSACHDRSPFITIRCQCGGEMHLHLTQLEGVLGGAEIYTPCQRCHGLLVFESDWLRNAFRKAWDPA